MMRRHLFETWYYLKATAEEGRGSTIEHYTAVPSNPHVTASWLDDALNPPADDSQREYAEVVDIEIETLMTDVSGRVRDMSNTTQQPHCINTLRRPLYIRIYPSHWPSS